MTRWIAALPLAAACLLAAAPLQQARRADVVVSVLDSKGDAVEGLTATDFKVREDGVAREVLAVRPASDDLTVALLVDDSQPLSGIVQMVREGVHDFITTLGGKSTIALISFGERPTILVDYTKDQKKLLDAAARLFPRTGSGAYFLEALIEVSKGLTKREAARSDVAAFVIEGSPEFANRYYQQVLDEFDKTGAALHVIAYGEPNSGATDEARNRNQVLALGTERSGGRRDQVLAQTAIPGKMKQLANELLHQYVVTYGRPERLIPPEKLDVTVTRPGLTARARTRAGK
jgi:Ca-activated chloride channel homolog